MSNKPLIILSALACLTLVGCSEKGPAEQAGENLDQAVEQAKDAVEEAGEKIDQAVEQTEDAIEDAGQQGPAEEAGEKIDETVEDMKKDDAAE